MPKNVDQTIRELMSIILNIEAARIDDGTSMDNTPGWDSANHINLILALEDECASLRSELDACRAGAD